MPQTARSITPLRRDAAGRRVVRLLVAPGSAPIPPICAADQRAAGPLLSPIVWAAARFARRRAVRSIARPLVGAAALALVLAAGPVQAQAQDYRLNDALGQALTKKPYIETKTNPGGRGILDNSCIYKDSFSLTPSEVVLDHCDVAGATAKFIAQYGPPEQTSDAAGGKKLLEYRLLHNENSYLVKIYLSCAQDKTEQFAMVECKNEKNRAKPGPPPDNRPFWKKISPF